ncbi:hypothetical protein LguiA_014948 [Lonicera macranthoides]
MELRITGFSSDRHLCPHTTFITWKRSTGILHKAKKHKPLAHILLLAFITSINLLSLVKQILSSSITMANLKSIRVSLLILILLLSHMRCSRSATSYGRVKSTRKMIDSRRLLRELGIDLSKRKKGNNGRQMAADTDRVAPEGPDPQHH